MKPTIFLSFLFVFLLSIHSVSKSQTVSGDVVLNSQGAVNSFSGTAIQGKLYISGENITDLTPLKKLTKIGSDLIITRNNLLKTLQGLGNIESIDGNLEIYMNGKLLNLNGLEKLKSIKGYLKIKKNSKLENINGLKNLSYLGHSLLIYYNETLPNLDGLNNLKKIKDNLIIYYNISLLNINGLNNIESVERRLGVWYNFVLKNLDGLRKIKRIGNDLEINNNYNLKNIEGLNQLTYIGDDLNISNNDLLENLYGLDQLNYVGNNLKITDNDMLNNFCSLYNLLNSKGLRDSYDVYNNSTNPTKKQILNNGPCSITDTQNITTEELENYVLKQNYPNPFNPETTISFSIPIPSKVVLTVSNVLGQVVATLVDEQKSAGNYKVTFDGKNLPSNVYFYHLQAGDYSETKKLLLMK